MIYKVLMFQNRLLLADTWTKCECVLAVQECDELCPILHATLHVLWGVHSCVVTRIPHVTHNGNLLC